MLRLRKAGGDTRRERTVDRRRQLLRHLVLAYSDGTQAEFGRSASTTQDWTFWDTTNHTAFAEYTYALPKDWNLKFSYNYRAYRDDSKLFFAYSADEKYITSLYQIGYYGAPRSYSVSLSYYF
jgi:outer membrane receptor for ferric coprogen and ferric-rhodotorulic acid